MSTILESMMAKPRAFLPETVTEYTALQLAKKLTDAANVLRYVSLLDRYGLAVLCEAYSKTRANNQEAASAEEFAEALRVLTEKETSDDL